MKKPKITKKGFQEWLTENPKKRFEVGDSETCAVAAYVRSLVGKGPTIEVDGCNIVIDDPKTEERLELDSPTWVDTFITKFDASPNKTMTAAKALELL